MSRNLERLREGSSQFLKRFYRGHILRGVTAADFTQSCDDVGLDREIRRLGKPMDPSKVAEQASHLPLAARIALPWYS